MGIKNSYRNLFKKGKPETIFLEGKHQKTKHKEH
jgi:hypothetical protein